MCRVKSVLRLKQGLILLAAVAIAGAVYFAGEIILHHELGRDAETQLRDRLEGIAAKLSTEIKASEHLGRGLAAVIAAEGGMSRETFNGACDILMKEERKIRNVALVIGSTINYNCPEAENSSTIGVDLKTRPDQWPAFLRMQQTGQPEISGPVNLVQGGWAIIARTPIMIPDSSGTLHYWGALSIPLHLDEFLVAAGFNAAQEDLQVAIRGNSNATLAPQVLFGDASVFEHNPVAVPIAFPDGDWSLAAAISTIDERRHAQFVILVILFSLLGGGLFLMAGLHFERRRRMETESGRFRDLLRAFMENSPIAMYVKDIDGGYIDLNAEARKSFKVGDRPYIGGKAVDFFPSDMAETLRVQDQQALAGEVVRAERQRPGDGGSYEFEREIKFPVTDADGKVIAIGGYVIDVTASKQAEIRLIRALRHAETANRAKSEFLATMSHELRTPFNAIIGFSDVMKSQMFGPLENAQYLEYVARIHESGTHLADLLGGLIDLSAVESGHLEVRIENLTPEDVLRDCRTTVESLAREHQHELVIDNRATGLCRADRRLLRQSLLNLASNAAKYTRRGGRIELATFDRNDRIVFKVADNGIGMAPADVERALQPFTRLGDPMRAEVGGSGIGLTLVKRLVDAMEGTLTIHSNPGIGTSVEIALLRA